MSSSDKDDLSNKNRADHGFRSYHFELAPMQEHRIYLGRFRIDEPTPRFITKLRPAQGTHSISHRDIPVMQDTHTYTLHRHFQSYADRTYHIALSRTFRHDGGVPADISDIFTNPG